MPSVSLPTSARIAPDMVRAVGVVALRRCDYLTAALMIRGTSTRLRSRHLLGLMARHPISAVRQYLALRPATPRTCHYQETLALDPDRSVRLSLARCSGYVCGIALTELSVDEDSSVRSAVAQRKDLSGVHWATLMRDPSEPVRMHLARNPHAPQWVVRRLCADASPRVRHSAQGHPHASLDGRVEAALLR